MTELLPVTELPEGFSYPPEFIRVVGLGLIDLEPWHVLEAERLRSRHAGLAKRFPGRELVPFAARQDNDDVACWDLELGPGVVAVVHDFASSGWERREEFPGFYDWLRHAIEDLIEFG